MQKSQGDIYETDILPGFYPSVNTGLAVRFLLVQTEAACTRGTLENHVCDESLLIY